jgi:hypothetical protein
MQHMKMWLWNYATTMGDLSLVCIFPISSISLLRYFSASNTQLSFYFFCF